jgi:hypothetical protein
MLGFSIANSNMIRTCWCCWASAALLSLSSRSASPFWVSWNGSKPSEEKLGQFLEKFHRKKVKNLRKLSPNFCINNFCYLPRSSSSKKLLLTLILRSCSSQPRRAEHLFKWRLISRASVAKFLVHTFWKIRDTITNTIDRQFKKGIN